MRCCWVSLFQGEVPKHNRTAGGYVPGCSSCLSRRAVSLNSAVRDVDLQPGTSVKHYGACTCCTPRGFSMLFVRATTTTTASLRCQHHAREQRVQIEQPMVGLCPAVTDNARQARSGECFARPVGSCRSSTSLNKLPVLQLLPPMSCRPWPRTLGVRAE